MISRNELQKTLFNFEFRVGASEFASFLCGDCWNFRSYPCTIFSSKVYAKLIKFGVGAAVVSD